MGRDVETSLAEGEEEVDGSEKMVLGSISLNLMEKS